MAQHTSFDSSAPEAMEPDDATLDHDKYSCDPDLFMDIYTPTLSDSYAFYFTTCSVDTIEEQIGHKVAQLEALTWDLLKGREQLEMLEAKQEAALKKYEGTINLSKGVYNCHYRDARRAGKLIGRGKALVEKLVQKIRTVEQEIEDLRMRLRDHTQHDGVSEQVAQDSTLHDNTAKRPADLSLEGLRKRLRIAGEDNEGKPAVLKLPKFVTCEESERGIFAKRNGIIFTYAPVGEDARQMVRVVFKTLNELVSPMPLQLRGILQDWSIQIQGRDNRDPNDENYHLFFDRLRECICALQKDVGVLMSRLIDIRGSFNANTEIYPEKLIELFDSLECTYRWSELHQLLDFGLLENGIPDRYRRSLCQALRKGLGKMPLVDRERLTCLIGHLSRIAFWVTLLGGCLVEGFGRGDFADGSHGISGLDILDMAQIIEGYDKLEETGFPSIDRQLLPLATRYRLQTLRSRELDGVAKKILGKLMPYTQELQVNILEFLRGGHLYQLRMFDLPKPWFEPHSDSD